MAYQGRKYDSFQHAGTGITVAVKIESGRHERIGAPRQFFAEVEGQTYSDPTYAGLVAKVTQALDGMVIEWTPAIYVNTGAEGSMVERGPYLPNKQTLGLGVERYWVRPRREGGIAYSAWDCFDHATGEDHRNQRVGVLDTSHWGLAPGKPIELPHSNDWTNVRGETQHGTHIWLPYDDALYQALVTMQVQVAAMRDRLLTLLRIDNGRAIISASAPELLATPEGESNQP